MEPAGLPGELLGLLIVQSGERLSRDQLADSLWPNGDVGRNRHNLNTTLWRLRTMLEPDGKGEFLHSYPGGFVGFNRSAAYFCDVEELEAALREASLTPVTELMDTQLTRLRLAVDLYHGEFLEGVMSEWVLPHRDRLARSYQECLLKLMKAAASRESMDESVYWAERVLDQDPLREDVHRVLMETYDRLGERQLALRQYDRMRSLLEDELNARPSKETQALYYRVIDTEDQGDHGSEADRLGEVLGLFSAIEQQLASGITLLAEHLKASHH